MFQRLAMKKHLLAVPSVSHGKQQKATPIAPMAHINNVVRRFGK
jgi:hypothetical protein